MAPLIITASILLFIFLILSLRAIVTIEYTDEVKLFLRILFFKIRIIPHKKKKININKYKIEKFRESETKKYQKALKKYNKKQEKVALKKKSKEKREGEEIEPPIPFSAQMTFIQKLVGVFFYRFARHFRIYISRMKINVATGDAATTAILYGVVIQSVSYIIEILQRVTNLDRLSSSDIQVNVDYLAEKTTADICIKFSLRVWHLFDIAFHAAFGYFKHKPSSPKEKNVPVKSKNN